ncbi:unnamed protein product [Rhodiola kirilowii]
MSREGSHHNYQDDDEINLYDRNDEVPLPFVDDPEQIIRNRRARDRDTKDTTTTTATTEPDQTDSIIKRPIRTGGTRTILRGRHNQLSIN